LAGNQGSRYVAVRLQVRWGDCDPAGIAFYPRFFEWMDGVSHVLARELGISRDDMLPPRSLSLPLVAAAAEFTAPARLEDALEVRAWITRIGRTSFGIRHEIRRVEDDQLLARGSEERVLVGRDSHGSMRPQELTPRMQEALTRYQG
jgi:4-hydroxybenzoyl-CoA thioesterase